MGFQPKTVLAGCANLATVTFDTTGIGSGGISWGAATSLNGKGYYSDTVHTHIDFTSLIDGTLTFVPEPVNLALGIFGSLLAAVALCRWWRKGRRPGCTSHRCRDARIRLDNGLSPRQRLLCGPES